MSSVLLAFSSGNVEAKPWKGAEAITTQTFKFGAFEARIRATKGGGQITPFFLWKDGSELPGAQWQEMDFEIFGRDGSFQSQLMTPGKLPGDARTEHVAMHYPTTPAFDRYNTYRMEWTPDSLCFYYNGQLLRKETDKVEYAKLMDPNLTEAMQLRISNWAGDFAWSGPFDSTAVPASVFVNWVQVYAYTPGTGPGGSNFTSLWRDDFNSWNSSRWWLANWTFEFAVNDYVSTNATARDGSAQLALTHWTQMGTFAPTPVDDGKTPPLIEPLAVDSTPIVLPALLPTNRFVSASDKTPGNVGVGSCRAPDLNVDYQLDQGVCYVSNTSAGEWLEYIVTTPVAKKFDIAFKVGTTYSGRKIQVYLDGAKLGPAVEPLAKGWTTWDDAILRGVQIPAGRHVLRVLLETGNTNIRSIDVRDWNPVISVPGRVPVDAYVAYNDLSAGNTGGACRQDDVDLQTTTDLGGGCSIGWTQAGEWVEYLANFAESGWYEFSLRMASAYAGRTAKIMVDGRDAAVLTAPVDGWLAFSDVKSAPVAIAAGQHTIRIHFQTGNTNTRYLDIAKLTGLPPQVVTGLAGTARDGSVDLVWDASIGATSYKVVRGTDTVATVSGTAYNDAAVINGTTYSYTIVASNSFGNASASAAVSVTPMAPPPPPGPEGLVANASDAQVQLSWTPTAAATVYKIYRSLDGVWFQPVGTTSNAQYLDAGLQNGTVYSYFVTSKNVGIKGDQESRPSDTVQVTPRGNAPPKVTGLVATPGEDRISLAWDFSPQAMGYAIHRGVEDGPMSLVTVTSSPRFIDFAVAMGTRYSYAIVASNDWGEAPTSDTVIASIPFPPDIPVNLVAVAGNGTVSLTWLGGPNTQSFNVYREVPGGASEKIATGLTSAIFTDATVVNGTVYLYFVTGVNGAMESFLSHPAQARPDFPDPEIPVNLVAVAGNGSVSLNWVGGPNDLSYNVYRGVPGGASEQIATGLTSATYTDATVINGTEYVYHVAGVNGTKESPRSNEAYARPDFPDPEIPMNLAAIAGNAVVTLTWGGGPNDLSFNVYREVAGGASEQIATGLTSATFTDATVVNGTEYAYFVTGVNGTKESPRSGAALARPDFPDPEIPMNLAAVAGNATVSLSWMGGPNIVSYNVYREVAGGASEQIATGLTSATFTDATVVNGTEYAYFVTGVNGTKESPRSGAALARPDFPDPEIPMNLAAVAGNATVSLSWMGGPNIVSYNVYREVAGGASEQIATGLTSATFTDATVVNGTEYVYHVTGVNGTKESPRSFPARATPGVVPEAVTGLVVTAGSGRVELNWNASAGAVSYKLLRAVGGQVFQQIALLDAPGYLDLAVSNGLQYSYFVVAANGFGDAAPSATVLAAPDFATPGAPSSLAALAGVGSVSLSWIAGADNASFEVRRSVAGSTEQVVATGLVSTSYLDVGVVAGTEYTYTVVGLNGTKTSLASNAAVVVPRGQVPVQATGLVATAGNATVALVWSAATGATLYKVVRGTDTLARISATSYTDNAVVNGTTYSYSIVASNLWGDAPASASVSAKPIAPTASLKAVYKAGTVGATTNGIRPLLQIVNSGTTPVALSKVTARYWFTNNGSQAVTYWCDWAQIGQTNLTGTVKTVSPARVGADRYLEIAFKTSAGNLAAGASTGEIQSRFSKSDWTNFTQSDDYSYDATKATSYSDWNRVTVYVDGALVWGVEP